MSDYNKKYILIGVAGYIAPRHLHAIKETGGELDQAAIKDKVEQFRERFMNEMGGAME